MEDFQIFCRFHGEPENMYDFLCYAWPRAAKSYIPTEKSSLTDAEIGVSIRRRKKTTTKKTSSGDSGGTEKKTRRKKKTGDGGDDGNDGDSNTKKKKNKKDGGDDDDDDDDGPPSKEEREGAVKRAGNLNSLDLRGIMDSLMAVEMLGKVEFVQKITNATLGRYQAFTEKLSTWLMNFDPKIIPDQWWDTIVLELQYRADNFITPLSPKDVLLWYNWLTNWITGEVADRLRARDMEMATTFVEDFQKFALAWGPALETALAGTPQLVGVFAQKVIKQAFKLIIRLIKTVVYLILDIIIRVLKSIPYTFWLGYILGYVMSVIEVIINGFI